MKWINLRKEFWLRFQTLIFDGGLYRIETSPLICTANQWTGFYVTGTFVIKELIKSELFFNKLTTNYEYSRSNRKNLPVTIQRQLSEKLKTFS